MKSRDALIRLKRFQAEEKRRRVVQLNAMIAEFTRMANELEREIGQEERRANISDLNHFAYPTYARAARTRRENILASISELRVQIDEAEAQFKEASEDLSKAQNQEARDRGAERMIDVVAERRHAEMPEAFRRA
ncbi:MAG: flagellar export protein FliJ [Alphaproteobacteria bacterium]|nr:flagellar export protein FliJ [Alphaproteobacteria bacterium]